MSRLAQVTQTFGGQQRIRRLQERVRVLEDEMQEARRLNRRLAELTDVVEELLLPTEQRDEEKLRAALDRYSSRL